MVGGIGGTEPQVLVVGAGPSGLTMAAELARRKVPFRIVDRATGPTSLSKATGMQARTVEVLRDMGVADEIVSAGHVNHAVNIYRSGKGRLLRFSYDELESPYPFLLTIRQSDTERILGGLLQRLGGSVEWNVELVHLEQDDDAARATLRHPDGREERLEVPWLVACDGARSTVRNVLGVDFTGETYPQWFALADARMDWDLPNDEVHCFVHPNGFVFVFPMPGDQFRLVVEASEHVGEPTLEDFQAAMDERGPGGARVYDPGWITPFHVNSRRAAHHRVGRCFLAGDAAHIHSPAGGQGLNTSIQDTYNLAWKLALVTQGYGRESLLDSYEAERAPVAKYVLKFTDRITRLITMEHHLEQTLRDRFVPLLGGMHVVQHSMADQDAELVVNYHKSPIVGQHHHPGAWAFTHGPKPGERAPDTGPLDTADGAQVRLFDILRGTSHVLVLFVGAHENARAHEALQQAANMARQRYPELVEVWTIRADGDAGHAELVDATGAAHDRYHAHHPCLYLVRPDGYVGFRSQPVEAERLEHYLDSVLLPASQ